MTVYGISLVALPAQPVDATQALNLSAIWRRAFSMDFVGTADSYEDLGGDSLIAVGILSELETEFKVRIPLGLCTASHEI
jgi:Phosphopantetheine attachment site